MHKLGFAQKLWLPLVVSLVALLLVSVSAAWLSRQTRIDERKNDLNNIAHVGLSIVDEYAALAKSGAMSEADARKEALARLRDIRYGEDGYLLVIDSTPRMIMHPIKPATNGKLLADTADADGRHHYVCVTRRGTGSSRPALMSTISTLRSWRRSTCSAACSSCSRSCLHRSCG